MFSEHFYTSPYGLTEVLTVLQCSFMSSYANSQIYSSRNICPMASLFPHRSDLSYAPVCIPVYAPSLTDRSQPIRPMLSLSLNIIMCQFNNLKEFPPLQNKYSTLHVEEDRSHEVNTSDHPSSHLSQRRFNSSFSSQDNLTLQTPQKQVKDHRVHKYAGNYLLLKRKARSQEGV